MARVGSILYTVRAKFEKGLMVDALIEATQSTLRVWAEDIERRARESMGPAPLIPTAGAALKGVPSPVGTPPHSISGFLKSSISHAQASDTSYIIGPVGSSPYGKVHERGWIVAVTEKMRRFLRWAYGWHVSNAKQIIIIPRRQYMFPALVMSMHLVARTFKLNLSRTSAGRTLNAKRNA